MMGWAGVACVLGVAECVWLCVCGNVAVLCWLLLLLLCVNGALDVHSEHCSSTATHVKHRKG